MTTLDDAAERRCRQLAEIMTAHPSDIFLNVLRTAWTEATEAAALKDEAIVRKYLQRDDQRAVSWHEVQDCCDAIRGRK